MLLALALAALFPARASAEDGYRLWLRYAPLSADRASEARAHLGPVQLLANDTATVDVAEAELARATSAMLGGPATGAGLILATRAHLTGAQASWARPLQGKAAGAYRLLALADGRTAVVANDDAGLLYGSFALLSELGQGRSIAHHAVASAPAFTLRMIDH